MPRPKLSAAEKRDHRINTRWTLPEREEIRTAAARVGLTEAEYLRRRVLGHRLPSGSAKRSDPSKIAALNSAAVALSRVGNNLNQLTHAAHVGRELKGLALSLQPEVQAELRAIKAALANLLAETDG